MGMTKSELAEINEQLRLTVQELRNENQGLRVVCSSLEQQLQVTQGELTGLQERYQRFSDYVKRLRLWILSRDGG